jgi:hypothetical protein
MLYPHELLEPSDLPSAKRIDLGRSFHRWLPTRRSGRPPALRYSVLVFWDPLAQRADPPIAVPGSIGPPFDFLHAAHPEDELATDVLRKQFAWAEGPNHRSTRRSPLTIPQNCQFRSVYEQERSRRRRDRPYSWSSEISSQSRGAIIGSRHQLAFEPREI